MKKATHRNQIISFNFPSILTILPSCFHHALKCVPSFFQNFSQFVHPVFHHVPQFRIIVHDVFIIFPTFMIFSIRFSACFPMFPHVFTTFPLVFAPFNPSTEAPRLGPTSGLGLGPKNTTNRRRGRGRRGRNGDWNHWIIY